LQPTQGEEDSMDWLLAPWIAMLAGGWLLAVGVHAANLVPARADVQARRRAR
jgi:hypothetical protein